MNKFWGWVAGVLLLAGCQKDPPPFVCEYGPKHSQLEILEKDARPEKEVSQPSPLTLPVVAQRAPLFGGAEKIARSEARTPWDNYVQSDVLVEKLRTAGELPIPPAPPGWAGYKEAPFESMIREGRILFPVVHRMYRAGILSREPVRRAEVVQALRDEVVSRGDSAGGRVNELLALLHIGYDEEALQVIERDKAEPWFQKSWDANFFAGTLLFRHRSYARASVFLKHAHAIHPEKWSRLWLELSRSESSPSHFVFGDHMGPNANRAEGPEWVFVDRSEEWGMRRWQLAGAIAFGDFDNDTWVDFVATGVHASPELYWNKPGEGFVPAEVRAFSETGNVPPGCVAADFDNDGFTDLYMTRAAWFGNGPNRLFHNREGKGFEDISLKSGAALTLQNSCGATGIDFNRDGLLDLAVSGTSGGTLRLLQNMGGMRFKEVSSEVGIQPTTTVAVSVAAGDANGDGWLDLFVNTRSSLEGEEQAPGNGPNHLYMNTGKGSFKEEAAERGVAWGTTQGFGSWFFDYDNDGDVDILASNFTDEDFVKVLEGFETVLPWAKYYHGSALYENDGSGNFVNVGKAAGFIPASVMGAQVIDYNLDGWLDVVLGPGSHPLRNMQPLFVYRNNGDKTFTNVAPTRDPTLFGKFHGIAFSDVDHDGDPDLYVNNGGVLLSDRWRDLFLENQTQGQSWLHFRLVGTKSNRGGIGARVTVRSGNKTWMQEVAAGQGFASTNGPYLIFGLGTLKSVDSVEIRWPSGLEETLPGFTVNQAIEIQEGSSEYRRHY